MTLYFVNGEKFEFPTFYMQHKVYTVESALEEIRNKLRDAFLLTNKQWGGVNVTGELFQLCCFNAHTDPVTDFVVLETFYPEEGDALEEMFFKSTTIRPKPEPFQRINIWFSLPLKRFLGNFKVVEGAWTPEGEPVRVVKHGVALGCLVMEKLFEGKESGPYLCTAVGSCPNRRTLLHVKSDLTAEMRGVSSGGFGTLDVCKIPASSEVSIELAQDGIKWKKVARTGRVDQFKIALEDNGGELIPFTGFEIRGDEFLEWSANCRSEAF